MSLPCGCKIEWERSIEYEPQFAWQGYEHRLFARTLVDNTLNVRMFRLCDHHRKDNFLESFYSLYNTYVKIRDMFKHTDQRFIELHLYSGIPILPNGLSD